MMMYNNQAKHAEKLCTLRKLYSDLSKTKKDSTMYNDAVHQCTVK